MVNKGLLSRNGIMSRRLCYRLVTRCILTAGDRGFKAFGYYKVL